MTGPLTGLRIVEFAGLGPGPFCAMMFADHGAEVIRVDRIGGSVLGFDPVGEFWNRSRKSISVNLKSAEGVALVRKLCAGADALLEGFRPCVMERLGLGPDVMLADNPKLVYGRMTGWGQDGPYANMAGHDINYIALSGALHAIGRKGEKPVPPLNLIGDFGGGGMMLAFGMLAALLSAQKTGQGQVVDCAMSEGSAVLMAMIYSLRAQERWRDERGVNFLDSAAPYYDSYETADGKYLAVGAIEPQFYRKFISLLGFGDDPAFAEQENRREWPAQKEKIAARIKAKSRSEWCSVFDGQDACVAPIMSLDEAPGHYHNKSRGAFVDVNGASHPSPAPRYSRSSTKHPAPLDASAAAADCILADAGFATAEIAQLRQAGVVG
jgi:alpha-methylacyl-CoA racemase